MVSTGSWCLRGCVLILVTASLAACSRVVAGTVASAPEDAGPPVPVTELLIEPDRFPSQYPAAVLDATAVYRVLQDVDAVPVGSVVTPRDCAPPDIEQTDAAAVEGIDSATAASLIVLVTRPAPPLTQRADQLRACGSFAAGRGEATSTVDVTLLPAPPVDADDSYAVDQTVTTARSERRMLTLVAQIGDTRVSATWSQNPAVDDPDTSSLDTLFRDAVVKLRRGG